MDPSFFVSWIKQDVTRAIPLQERHMMVCVIASCPYQAQSCLKAFLAMVAAVQINGIEDVIIYEETVDGEVFSSYIEQTISPILQPFNSSNQFWLWTMHSFIIYHHHTVQGAWVPVQYWRQWLNARAPLAQVSTGDTTPCATTSASFNRWYHPVCNHQRKFQQVILPRVQVEYLHQ